MISELLGIAGSISEVASTLSNHINAYSERRFNESVLRLEEINRRSDKASKRYALLYNEIFLPLNGNIVYLQDNGGYVNVLIFNGDLILSSRHSKEGIEHLKICIPDFEKRFTEIRYQVQLFNSEIDDFYTKELYEIVSDYLIENGFTIVKGASQNPMEKDILIDYLFPALLAFWFKNEHFDLNDWGDSYLRIRGAAIASSDEEYQVEDHIEYLRNLDDIHHRIGDYTNRMKSIIVESQKLSQEIGDKIMRYIENGEYNTQCKFCEKYIMGDDSYDFKDHKT